MLEFSGFWECSKVIGDCGNDFYLIQKSLKTASCPHERNFIQLLRFVYSKSFLNKFLTNSSVSQSLTLEYFNMLLYKNIVSFGLSVFIHVNPLQPIAISNFNSLPIWLRNVEFDESSLFE